MSKFFDFCDYRKNVCGAIFFLYIILSFIFPILSYWDYFERTHYDVPFFVHYILEFDKMKNFISEGASIDFPQYIPLNRQLVAMDFFICLSFFTVVICTALFFVTKKRKTLIASIAVMANVVGTVFVYTIDYRNERMEHTLYGNGIASIVLLILYIIYHLLRRYYAPVKARIQASRAERQANRKPTKDERIAELERKVAELESKDKDDQ